ncbi:GntR family transcriptional regulator [Oceanibaculum sp.]|uniref:GntR family transcriptional regulator n=1 Tax=Oceanibaculum sp. TaxID=1903597 RepID=UPI0025885413|nr:GntR family transcriptional regulator [Oceanibaculum sp.]MCH2394066.1 GntR family transcriptional regulator [Oceanibaculum sp.]
MRLLQPDDFRNASRAELVYRALRAAIRDGEMEAGERLRETDIAEKLGVSRTPVREALQRLTAEGLLSVTAGRGVIVTEFDKQQVLELYALREVLEGAAAAFAAERASETDIDTLRQLIEDEAAGAGDGRSLAATNRAFHAALCEAAHNRYLTSAISALADSIDLLRGTTLAADGRRQEAEGEHRAIVDAIERCDPAGAERIARDHIREARRIRLRMLSPQR